MSWNLLRHCSQTTATAFVLKLCIHPADGAMFAKPLIDALPHEAAAA
jgi:hypothetical protein